MSRHAAPIALAAVAALAAACGPAPSAAPSGPPAGGLAQARAVELAAQLASAHQGPLSVETARSGTFADLGNGVSLRGVAADQWAWSITFRGEFTSACASPGPATVGAAASQCPSSGLNHDTVIIDYRDGRLLISSLGP